MNKLYFLGKYILIVGILILGQSSLLADPPTQLLPQNGDDCVNTDAVFEWTSVANASNYMYIISESSDFSDTVTKDLEYQDTTVAFTLPENSKKYYWKVGVQILGEPDEWSNGFELTTSPAPPVQIAPADMLTCQPFEQEFRWNTIENGTEYRIQISKSANFSSVVIDSTITDTSITLTMDTYFQNYYWRVKAEQVGCITDWSGNFQFQTIVGPPALQSPADGAVGLDLTVLLEWPQTAGANEYELQVSDDVNFSNLLVDETNLQQLTYTFNAANRNQEYFWRLRTVGQNCTSAWSNPSSFNTGYDAVTLISPEEEETCVSIKTEFVWSAIAGVTNYHIQASSTPGFATNNLLFENEEVSGTSVIGDVANESSVIYWRVRASDTNNVGIWSEVGTYNTTGEAPIPVTPDIGSTEVPRGLTFEWAPNGAALYFQIQVSTDPTFNNIEIDESNFTDTKIDLVLEKYNTEYYYRIRTFNNGCFSDWSVVFNFTTIQGFPNLLSPANQAENIKTDAFLEWSLVPTAQTYDFRISENPDMSESVGQNGLTNINFLVRDLKPFTTYYWYVRSNDQWGTSPWSPVSSFTTGDGETDVPSLILPENGSVMVPTEGVMTWNLSPNASSYTLQIAKDIDFLGEIIEITDIQDTVYNYTDLEHYTEYWFRVSAVNATTVSDYSSAFKFRTIAEIPSEMAMAVSPTDGETGVDYLKTTLEWTFVPNTDVGLSSDAGYELLISTSEDFSDTTFYYQKVYDEARFFDRLLDFNTTYYWKVRGWNEAGFGPWSDAFSFTTTPQTSVAVGMSTDFGATVVPNPIESRAEFRFDLDTPASANLTIVDQNGNIVMELNNIETTTNTNTIPLNLEGLSSGSYLFNLQVGNKFQVGKIIISR
jgi:hypothetical protein